LSVSTRSTVIPHEAKNACARIQKATAVSFFSSVKISL
jgi:hypothetical protein